VTLVEVLVTIFIMGIGMIALLTLFPLGALTMAQAIRDDRIGNAAGEAAALANAFNVRNDANAVALFNNYLTAGPGGTAAANPTGPGYPVYVDPFYATQVPPPPNLGVLAPSPGIDRCTASYVGGTNPAVARFFALRDDINFANNGVPVGSPGVVQRGGGYTWAYLLRRNKAASGAEVDLTVVVYAGRSIQLAAGENTYTVNQVGSTTNAANAGDTAVDLSWSGAAPAVRRGAWLLDTSYETTTSGTTTYGTVHGQFYRIVNVSGSASPYTLELDQPLKHSNVNAMVVMENVAEVFYKGSGWRP
jgi:Tfp pilus assembly protein PilV